MRAAAALSALAIVASVQPIAAQIVRFGGEFVVTNQWSQYPTVAIHEDGGFVVAFQAGDADVYARRFSHTGEPFGGEFKVNTNLDGWDEGGHGGISVASDGNGAFVVAWSEWCHPSFPTPTCIGGVFAKAYDADGAPHLAGEFYVADPLSPAGARPSVAWLSDSGFVVAWEGQEEIDGDDGDKASAFQLFSGPQSPTGSYVLLPSIRESVSVASGGAADFVVSGMKRYVPYINHAIFMQRFSEGGGNIHDPIEVDHAEALEPDVEVLANGDAVVVWQDYTEEVNHADVYVQLLDSLGNSRGEPFRANWFEEGDQGGPHVASDGAGNFGVVWVDGTQDGRGLFAQVFDQEGNRILTNREFRVDSPNSRILGPSGDDTVAINSRGDMVVVWPSDDKIYGQRYRIIPHTPPPEDQCGTFRVSVDGRILDANCNEFEFRGVNHLLEWDRYMRNGHPCTGGESSCASQEGFFAADSLPFIRVQGFNAVRLVWRLKPETFEETQEEWFAILKRGIETAIENSLIPVVELHLEDSDDHNDPEVLFARAREWRDFWNGLSGSEKERYHPYLIINIANEWGNWWMDLDGDTLPNDPDDLILWRNAYIEAVRIIREESGFDGLLMIDAHSDGQMTEAIKEHGRDLLSFDGNLVFSIHIYQRFLETYDLSEEIQDFQDLGIPIVIGELGPHGHGLFRDPTLEEIRDVMKTAEDAGVGYFGWAWQGEAAEDLGCCNTELNIVRTVHDLTEPVGCDCDYSFEMPECGTYIGCECEYDFRDWKGDDLTNWGDLLVNDEDYGVKATGLTCTAFESTPDYFECGPSTVSFAGQEWQTRCGPGSPGNGCFSNSPESVWVENDRLHLRIRQLRSGRWCQAEVWSQQPARFGGQIFQVTMDPLSLDDQTVLGMFLYKEYPAIGGACPDNSCHYIAWESGEDACVCEIDVEVTDAWGTEHCVNLSGGGGYSGPKLFYTTQPGNCAWSGFDLGSTELTHRFNWNLDSVNFRSWEGFCMNPPCLGAIEQWSTFINNFPEEVAPSVHLNLWTFDHYSVEQEVVIESHLGSTIFADDMESSDTTAWSNTVP